MSTDYAAFFSRPNRQPVSGSMMPPCHQPATNPLRGAASSPSARKPYGFTLSPSGLIQPGVPTLLSLRLFDSATGMPPSQLQIVHEKPAHIFMVSRDLSDFQHVHPQVVNPGLLQVPAQFKNPGEYKLFVQFSTPEKGEQTLSQAFQVGSTQPFPKPLILDHLLDKQVDGYTFRVSGLPTRHHPVSMFQVSVFKNGLPVKEIQPYLGAGAHGVIISADGQSFIHTHPASQPVNGQYQSPVSFHTEIKRPGIYKMWVQTRIADQIHTVDWTFPV